MEKIKIPNTDLQVSRLAAGCMGLGGGWIRDLELTDELEKQTRLFLEAALSLEINFFDHANIYAFGRAEEVFGRVMRGKPSLRSQIVIQSKCGIRWVDVPPGTPQRFDFSYENIIESVDGSLKRLGTDYLDILLLHRPDVLWEGEEIARAFKVLKSAGKVRYFGVSNMNRPSMEYLQSFLPDPLVANQIEMSLLHHGFAEVSVSFNQDSPVYPDGLEGVIEYCRLKGLSLQAWRPLAQGFLTGRDISKQPETVRKTAGLVSDYAKMRGVPAEAVVISWLLKHPAGIIPILGTTRPDRLANCAKSLDVTLSREEWYRLFETARGRPMP